jgi:hypothetical protein
MCIIEALSIQDASFSTTSVADCSTGCTHVIYEDTYSKAVLIHTNLIEQLNYRAFDRMFYTVTFDSDLGI